jgi:hypothetical protein
MIFDKTVNFIRYFFKNSRLQQSRLFLIFYDIYAKKLNEHNINKKIVTINFQGIDLLMNTDSRGIEPTIISGSWEINEIKLFRKKIINCDSLIDVGANVGIYSLLGLKVNPSLKNLIAIEPHPETYQILRQNLSIHLMSNVKLHTINKGASELSGFAELTNTDIPAATRLKNFSTNGSNYNRVEVINLDSLIEFFSQNSKLFIKIDVEGLEPSIICGGQKLITKFHPKILFELSSQNLKISNDSIENAAKVLELNYKIVNVITPRKTIRSREVTQTLIEFASKRGIFSVYFE